ncbi:MAG: YihY/virulence factor BrkB family protein, partial [Bacteroidota bacterium]
MLKFWKVLKQATVAFIDDNGMKLSASLSYYTIFSLGPVLLILISLAGLFFGREAVQGKIYGQINSLVGNEAALQIQEIIQNIEKSQFDASGVVLGVIVLIVGATGVFAEIQDSINYIWSIKAKPKRGLVKILLNRVISFSMIISFGFILMVSLAVHAFIDLLQDRLMLYFEDTAVYLFQMLNYILLFVIIIALFAIIFKVLPDASMQWTDAIKGASFTAVFFLVGKFLIGFYLGNSNLGVTYGAA